MYNDNTERYEYQGNVFFLRKTWTYNGNKSVDVYKIVRFDMRGGSGFIRLPGSFRGLRIYEMDLPWDGSYGYARYTSQTKHANTARDEEISTNEKNIYYGVKRLEIPEEMEEISINNLIFPDMEELRVDPENKTYSTDGRMLFDKKRSKLIYSLAAGMKEDPVTVPSWIRVIGKMAFRYTRCREIIFSNKNVSVEGNPFQESDWYKLQPDIILIGTLLFRVKRSMEEIRLPDFVRRIHEEAFYGAHVSHLICYMQPRSQAWAGKVLPFEELTITGKNTPINPDTMRNWNGVKRIHFSGHEKFKDEDGIIYTRDGKECMLCPRDYPEKAVRVQDGTVKIHRLAFAFQSSLEKVTMPDSVKQLGTGVFYESKRLKEVILSQGIREIKDATVFQPYGMFEGCRALSQVTLPEGLTRLGGRAFFMTALSRITIPKKVSSIGEYAFYASGLEEFSLPASVQYVGKGAFAQAARLTAYEGTARGLVSAIEAASPFSSEKLPNINWHGCVITMLRKRGMGTEEIFIPESLKIKAGEYIESAWNEEKFDFEMYEACFSEIQNSDEKLAFAAKALERVRSEPMDRPGRMPDRITGTALGDASDTDTADNAFENTGEQGGGTAEEEGESEFSLYLKRMSFKVASRLVDNEKEDALIHFIKKGFLSNASIDKLLKLCLKKNLTTASAYLLEMKEREKGGNRGAGSKGGGHGTRRKTAAVRI